MGASSAVIQGRLSVGHLPFRGHMNAGWRRPGSKFQGVDMGLIVVDSALQAGISNSPAVRRKLNAEFFTNPFRDLRHLAELDCIHVMDAQHRILVTLLGT